MTCPTSGEALERIACELHVMNEPTAFGWVPQLAPLATVLLSLLAVVFAVRSFLLARQANRVTRATIGRESREQLRQQAERACRRRWGVIDDTDTSGSSFRAAVNNIIGSAEKNGRAVALRLQAIDDVFHPGPDEQAVIARRPVIAAVAILDAWVEDPWDLKTMDRIWKLTLRTRDPVVLHQKLISHLPGRFKVIWWLRRDI